MNSCNLAGFARPILVALIALVLGIAPGIQAQNKNPQTPMSIAHGQSIDSENRMMLANSGSGNLMAEKKKVKDLVCGMEIDPDGPKTLKVERDGQTYYFCAAACKNKFLANPVKYIRSKPEDAPKMAKDFVCGMDVDPKSPNTLKTQYKGKSYYFCNESCKKSFEAAPEKYIKKGMAPDQTNTMRMPE